MTRNYVVISRVDILTILSVAISYKKQLQKGTSNSSHKQF